MGAAKLDGNREKFKVLDNKQRSDVISLEDSDPGMHLVKAHAAVEEGEGPWLVSYADLMTLLMGFFALLASMSTVDAKKFEQVQESATKQFGGDFKKPYQELTDKIQKIIDDNSLANQIKVTRDATGIEVKFDGKLFFDSGDYIVKAEGLSVVDKLVDPIKKDLLAHKLIIEGHTDNIPIKHSIIASNWELSGIRAARIAQVFEGKGFLKTQLTILGLGETKPEYPNQNEKGENISENQAKNRRVILRIFKE